MKTATFFILIAAIFLCAGSQASNADTTNASKLMASSGSANAFFNSETKTIQLKMFGENRMERMSVQLIDHNKVVVYDEIFIVNTNGVAVDIPTEIYGPGTFQLRVKGESLNFRNTYNFK